MIGVKLSNKAGFPEMFDVRVSQDQRFLFPALLGLAVGGILVIFDLFHPLGIPHIEFPISVAVYVHGGILSEIFFRLFPIPFLVWLISYVFLRNRWQTQAFWIVAALVSLFEPLMQVIALKQHLPLLMGLFGFIYAVNLTSAYFFRRYGFLANLTMRLSTYIIWHMLH